MDMRKAEELKITERILATSLIMMKRTIFGLNSALKNMRKK